MLYAMCKNDLYAVLTYVPHNATLHSVQKDKITYVSKIWPYTCVNPLFVYAREKAVSTSTTWYVQLFVLHATSILQTIVTI